MPEDFGSNEWLVEQMRRRYLEDPGSVSPAWREYFGGAAAPQAAPAPSEEPIVPADETVERLKGGTALIAQRMDESRELPTATSVRSFPAKLLEVNRRIINNQLARLLTGDKVSFTHLIGWAVVKATADFPVMNTAYREIDGQPHRVGYGALNLGLAMDVPRKDGSRMLLVPNVKAADTMDFHSYWQAYEAVVATVREGRADADLFADTTMTLTNPGTVGTVQSVPRLMPGQGTIVGVGAIKYPPEWEGADPATLAANGVGRVITMTSTYDHRIIQGAESGAFLARINDLLLGADGFYDEIFAAMQIPYVPARWATDRNPTPGSRQWAEKQARVFQLINIYRVRGHLMADLDPLRLEGPAIHPELDPLTYGITIWDLDRPFATGGFGGKEQMTAGEILGRLRDAYGRTIGVEFMHIQEPDQKAWIQARVESLPAELSTADKERILRKLTEAEVFETFLHTKYLGQKRFSLQGSESLIALLDEVLNQAALSGMEDVTIGMAHRGRLNVLANIIGKSYADIFREFEGAAPEGERRSGDVKYHLGARGAHTAPGGERIAVEVASNPSHLEAVDPVLEGIVRAKQDARGEGAEDLIFPLLIHGDAAFSGQGVVAETLNLSQLPGYYTGGTVHVVVNNQVGFTTGADEARSSQYATDVAKTVQAPIFHVNGDDAEAVVRVARLAFAFRQAFHKDVVIDLLCYRRYGHNEGDDPSYTQPRMYRVIEDRPSARHIYLSRLEARGDMSAEDGERHSAEFRALLDAAMSETRAPEPAPPLAPAPAGAPVPTAADRQTLDLIASALEAAPPGFTVHPKLERVLEDRSNLYAADRVDWALAEAMALGSLALDGHPVRFAGEDTSRGTFSHRHAVLVDNLTEEEWVPLRSLRPDQARVELIDSMLSEFAAMGFEYGYSVQATDAFVAWEAQFGDFVNGAQVIIDQFLAAGEDKWRQRSSLVVMLPHGFEGQGPEHSSARIERFLQACAEDNMRVAIPSTPSQYFHLLRRQVLDPHRKPLILFTPKSLLRTKASFSPVSDLTDGGLQEVFPGAGKEAGAARVVLCAGKFYYDLAAGLGASDNISLIRVEQLYPFPGDELRKALAAHPNAEVMWAQEEPENMGAWHFVSRMAGIGTAVTRPASASPATGSSRTHVAEQQSLVERALS